MPNGNTVKHGWILLCMCTPLYNETLRGCFTVGKKEKKKKCYKTKGTNTELLNVSSVLFLCINYNVLYKIRGKILYLLDMWVYNKQKC